MPQAEFAGGASPARICCRFFGSGLKTNGLPPGLRGRMQNILDWAKVRGYRSGENPSRNQMRQIEAFLRKYVPGFEDSYMVQNGV